MRRRSFLKGAGVVTIAVIGGGVWRAYDQGVFSVGEGPAYEPWNGWRSTVAISQSALMPQRIDA